jgi:hypothetical protein
MFISDYNRASPAKVVVGSGKARWPANAWVQQKTRPIGRVYLTKNHK